MRIERRWAGLLGMTALAGLWAFAVACGDEETPWPQTVLSGNPGGGVGGGSQQESDATVADDTGTEDSGDGGGQAFSCATLGANTGVCDIYTDVPTATVATLEAACGGTLGTTCPSTTGTYGAVVGCCSLPMGTYTEEECFYGGNTNPLGTASMCSTAGGQFSMTP
jgi:hypothetical protein